jgi:hypothetical protein
MPKYRVHRYVDKLFYPKSFPEVHRAIDRPCLFLGRQTLQETARICSPSGPHDGKGNAQIRKTNEKTKTKALVFSRVQQEQASALRFGNWYRLSESTKKRN